MIRIPPGPNYISARILRPVCRYLVLAVCLLALGFAARIWAADNSAYVPGQVIVQVEPGHSEAELTQDFAAVGLSPVRLLSRRMNIWLFQYSISNLKSATDNEAVLKDLRDHPAVAKGQFNHYVQSRSTIPDDPFFGNQWGLNNSGHSGGTVDADIDAPEAWDLVTGGSSAQGDDIVVAIIDAGFDLNHADIAYWKNTDEIAGNAIDDDGNGYVDDYDGWNAYNNNGSIPIDNHGTHVAGIAAAIGNNGRGVSGVNWGVKVMPVAGSSSQEATVIAAYGYVLELRSTYNETNGAMGAFVVATNASFGVDYGDPSNFPLWCAIYDSLGNAGILSAGATANLPIDIDVQGDVPTACPSDFMISVTNTTNTDAKNSSAAYGFTTIDLGSPGTLIYSTLPGSTYGYLTGTSMATPHVCGAIALLYAAGCPKLIDDYRADPAAVALQVRDFLLNGVDVKPSLQGLTVTGGRLNLYNSVLLMQQNYVCQLGITHTQLADTRDTTNDYEVACHISSDTALIPDSLLLHYSAGSGYVIETLTATGNPNEFHAYIPAQSPGTQIDYFLSARDEGGAVDTTLLYSFSVVDYDLSVTPAVVSDTVAPFDTVWYNFTLENTGLLTDEYAVGLQGNNWPGAIYDSSRTTFLSQTSVLAPGDIEWVSLRVIVPATPYGETDTAEIEVTSIGDPLLKATSLAVTTSTGTPLSLPFVEGFDSTELDQTRWVYVSNATVSTDGINVPSAPYSLNLDGDPKGADTVVSQPIDLSGETEVMLTYHYQRTGGGDSPEAGDSLVFEFLDDLGNWEFLSSQDGDGADMTTFTEEAVAIPANGLHNIFRLRIRNRATVGNYDDWFVDDIRVALPSDYAVDVTPDAQSHYGASGGASEFGLQIRNRGVLTDSYAINQIGGAWVATFLEVGGTNGISSTGTVISGDSIDLIVSVAVPPGTSVGTVDTTLIEVVSQGDMVASDTVLAEITATVVAGPFPWQESFDQATLGSSSWLSNAGADVSNGSTNPPSAPFALHLDGGGDTVTSQIIDLGGIAKANLTMYTERGGPLDPPEVGDDLTIEYRNQFGNWTVLSVIGGDGATQSTYARTDVALPVDALHGSFQLRLISRGAGAGTDDWFVDDLLLDYPPEIVVTPSSVAAIVIAGDTAHRQVVVSNTGQGSLSYSTGVQPHSAARSSTNSLISLVQWLEADSQLEPARHKLPDGYLDGPAPIKGTEDVIAGVPVLRDAGGPDGAGYYWIDSDQPDGPTFDWTDISSSGTSVVADLGDDAYGGPYALGFSFPYYDTSYSQIFIGSNGIVGFDSTNLDAFGKVTIPSASTPNAILAWMWDDLNPTDPTNTSTDVFVQSFPDSFVIQFKDYPEYNAGIGDVINAQVIVRADGSIRFRYLSLGSGFDAGSAAIGIENAYGTDGLEIAYGTEYAHDSLAVEIFKPTVWLASVPGQGIVAPGEADTLDVQLLGVGIDSGQYVADLLIYSNDLDSMSNPVTVPVTMDLYVNPPFICGDVDNSGSQPDVGDLTFLVSYMFKQGALPPIVASADVDSDPGLTIGDLTYLVAFMFKSGAAPICY